MSDHQNGQNENKPGELDDLLNQALNVDLTADGKPAVPGDGADSPDSPNANTPDTPEAQNTPTTEDKPPSRGQRRSAKALAAAARRAFLALSPVRRFFLCLCVVVALGALGYLGWYGIGTLSQWRIEGELIGMLPSLPPAPTDQSAQPAGTKPPSDAPAYEYPEPDPSIDYRALYADLLKRNPDFIGVLKIPGLKMEQMFVQTTNNDTYLKQNFDRKRSDRGTVFMDYQSVPDFSGSNTVLYGHNMKDGTMFRPLLKYETVKGYESAPYIVLETIYGPTVWLVFAAYTCEPDYGYANTLVSGSAYDTLLEEIHMRSMIHTQVEVDERDSILTLSTCDYDFEDARFAVHARRLRPGETLEEMSFGAVLNTNRKKYNVPYEHALTEIAARDAALSSYAELGNYYYYQRADAGVVWYTGKNQTSAQGPYMAYSGTIHDERFSWLAAGNNMPARLGKREFYIVSGGLSGNTSGLYLLQSNVPRGPYTLVSQTPLTPAGADARWPCLVNDGEGNVTLYYTVTETGSPAATVIYSMPLKGGKPKELGRFSASEDIRPVGAVTRNGQTAVIVQSFASGLVFGFYPSSSGPEQFELPKVGRQSGRYAVHLSALSGQYVALTQTGGRMQFAAFDTASVPAVGAPIVTETEPPKPSEPVATPEPTPIPTPKPTPQPTPKPTLPALPPGFVQPTPKPESTPEPTPPPTAAPEPSGLPSDVPATETALPETTPEPTPEPPPEPTPAPTLPGPAPTRKPILG